MLAQVNPFRTDRVLRIRYYQTAGERQHLLQAWHQHGRRGAIVGPEGSGKTTLLEDLAAALQTDTVSIRWLRFRREDPTDQITRLDQPVTSRDVVLIDGAEQASWIGQRVLRWRLRRAAGILATSHNTCWLPTVWQCSTNPELFQRIVQELAPEAFSASELNHAFHAHHGNIREALRELYDHCSQTPK